MIRRRILNFKQHRPPFNKGLSPVILRFQWEIYLPAEKIKRHPPSFEARDILIQLYFTFDVTFRKKTRARHSTPKIMEPAKLDM